MYQIKQKPEDFIVKEITDFDIEEKGLYSYFWLIKTNYTTMDAVRTIASRLNIPLKFIGFAGTKDKIAVTKQAISIKAQKERIDNLKLKDIKLEYIGQNNAPLSLGDLEGNEFLITVRNLTTKRFQTPQKFPNYFGPQRFSKNNKEIGKFLIKRRFKEAIELIDQSEVKDHLEDYPGDFIGALRLLPLKTRKLYIHAYQSFIWNETVKEYLKLAPHKNIKIPIIGFQTEIDELDNDIQKIIENLMVKEEISLRDFIIPQIKEISSDGAERDLFIQPQNLKTTITEDELNENKLKAIVSFSLQKGSYATVIIDYLFKVL